MEKQFTEYTLNKTYRTFQKKIIHNILISNRIKLNVYKDQRDTIQQSHIIKLLTLFYFA